MHRFGMPNRIIMDLGSPFTATEFKSWAHDYDFKIDYASVAHPEANGQDERANGLILAGLKPRLYEELVDYRSKWIEELPKVVRGATDSNKQSHRILTFLPGIRIRSRIARRPDLDITKDRAIQ